MIKEKLIDWMPEYYTGEHVKAIQEAREPDLQTAETQQTRVVNDMYVSTAEDIDRWENEYGVVGTGTLLQRQQNMLALIRGSGGAVTKDMIIAVVNVYTGTDATEITELYDESELRIKCTLSPTSYFDPDDLKKTLYKLIQAHVEVLLDGIFNYEVESFARTGLKQSGEYLLEAPITT